MYSTYLSPTESPPSSLDIKKALLNFDRVLIADPGDRDLFPPQAFALAMGLPPIFGFNAGPVRPLPKRTGFDNDFDKTMDEIGYARRQGLVDVVSTFDLSSSQQATIGAVFLGDYPLDPGFMLQAYRNIARDNAALMTAISGDADLLALPQGEVATLGSADGSADGSIHDDPALPAIDGLFVREELRTAYSSIARSRISAVMKAIGYCASKSLIPTFSNPAYGKTAMYMSSRAARAVDEIAKFDPEWAMRSQVLRIAHDEYVDDAILASLSIDDVVSMRTHAWGSQAETRDALLASASILSKEAESAADFDQSIKLQLADYRSKLTEVEKERSALNFKITCDVLNLTGTVAAGAVAGAAPGLLSQVQTAYGAAGLLIAGCLYTLGKVKDYKPVRDQIIQAESIFSDHAGFGVHNFYRAMK